MEVLARIKANIRRRNQYDQGSEDIPKRLNCRRISNELVRLYIDKEWKTGGTHCKRIRNFEAAYDTSEKVIQGQIYALVWKDAYLGDENAVNVHISTS